MRAEIFGPTLAAFVYPFEGGAEYPIRSALIGIETSKTLKDPAGTFSLTLTSERDANGRTWAKRIRPMDYVEIYMARTAEKQASNDLIGNDPSKMKIVMRCFVDNVFEDIRVSSNGRVQRVVTVNGRDFGKIVLKRALVFASEIDPTSSAFPEMFVGVRLGAAGLDGYLGFMAPMEFLSRVRDILLADPTVGAQFRNGRVPMLHAETDIPDSHLIQLVNVSPTTGSIWNFMQSFEGKPFNEMFIRDDDDFPRLHWRMAPLKDKSGRIARSGAQNPPTLQISMAEIIADQTGTSDNEAFCYYFTFSSLGEQLGLEQAGLDPATLGGLDTSGVSGTDNILTGGDTGRNPILRRDIFQRYGFQALRVEYPIPPLPLTVDREVNPDGQDSYVQELSNLNGWMHDAFSANPGYESGTLLLRGNPLVRIGNYLQITEQHREFYVEGVRNSFSIFPEPTFTTSVEVTRGRWYSNNPYPEMNWL